MKIKICLAIGVAIAIICGLAGCSNENEEATETIILGCDTSFAPMAFEEDGEIVGFDIDLAKLVFEDKMGVTLVIQPINWDSKEAELETGKIDVVWNGLTITDARKENMCMSEPYMENKQVIVVPKDSEIASSDDLAGVRVAMQKESTAVDAFASTGIEAETTQLKDNVTCLDELASGRQDAVIMDSVVADYYLTQNPDRYPFVILEESLADEMYGIAVKKGNDELMAQIEEALQACIEDGSAAEVSIKWFGSDKILTSTEVNSTASTAEAMNYYSMFVQLAKGSLNTIKIFIYVLPLSAVFGMAISLCRRSKFKLLKMISGIYIYILRGTPLILQMLILYYGLYYIPIIGKYLIIQDRFAACIIAFTLNYAAYFAEIFRSGFIAVDRGQYEAAKVLGLSRVQTLTHVIFPQMFRVALPSLANETITLMKDTSLIFALGIHELLQNATSIVNAEATFLPYVICAIFYLILTTAPSIIFKRLENKKFNF